MRIVFDCRSVFPGMGGIGRSTARLAEELPAALPEDEVVLLFGARRPEGPLVGAPNAREVTAEAGMIDPFFEQVRLPGLLDELEADLYHNNCFSVPIAGGRAKRVATVHDVVFRRRPELVEAGLRAYLDRWTEISCRLADSVVTVSEYSRREIEVAYGRAADRIEVVPNAVEPRFFDVVRPKPSGAPYVLYVGTLEAKKNVAELLAGFAALLAARPELPHRLVLAGGMGPGFDLERELAKVPAIRERVQVRGYVPEAELPDLYAGADLFVYLSEYEGFGLPPLEAMAAGVPTVVADRTSLPEVTGGASFLVDPASTVDVAEALASVLVDPGLRDELVARGRALVRRYSWRASTEKLAALYRSLVAPAPGLKVLVGGAA